MSISALYTCIHAWHAGQPGQQRLPSVRQSANVGHISGILCVEAQLVSVAKTPTNAFTPGYQWHAATTARAACMLRSINGRQWRLSRCEGFIMKLAAAPCTCTPALGATSERSAPASAKPLRGSTKHASDTSPNGNSYQH
jgi:hypothetical protein